LRIYPAALTDADEAYDWYNQARAGLGEEFSQELEQALDVLLRQPGMGSKRYAYLLLRFDTSPPDFRFSRLGAPMNSST
jgi:plasmid stabilization system protein ParE